ncbi:MAG: trypsin-like peptidase domain-containing protein [Aquihabitans sp.]
MFDGPLPGGAPPAGRSRALVAFVAFLAGALVVGAAFGTYAFGNRRGRSETPRVSARTTPTASAIPALNIRNILEIAQPSVVTIQTGTKDSIFGGAGSGVVLSADGLIVTNAHVIEGAAGVIQVSFSDGTTAPAELVGASTKQDIALIKTDRTGLTPAKLGSSANLRVGDDVVAIGNALNLGGDPSVTRGIVSAKDRKISDGKVSLEHLIQTDAAINPGNSGGPLIDASGEVVGINTAIIDGAQNVGFSIAIDSVKKLIPTLKAGKGDLTPDTAVLGVRSVTVDNDLDEATRQQYGVVARSGALIAGVEVDSPAADAGLEEGDVVVEVDGVEVASNAALTATIRTRAPGDRVAITVERRGRRQNFDVTLGST